MYKVIWQCPLCSCIKRLWTGAPVKIPAVCLTSRERGGWGRSRAREKEIRLRSERGKCSHSQGLWAPYIAANYLLSEVISFRTAELMWLAIKCPYFSLSREMPFLFACPRQSLLVLGAAKSTPVSSGALPNNDPYSLHKGKVALIERWSRQYSDLQFILPEFIVRLKHHLCAFRWVFCAFWKQVQFKGSLQMTK